MDKRIEYIYENIDLLVNSMQLLSEDLKRKNIPTSGQQRRRDSHRQHNNTIEKILESADILAKLCTETAKKLGKKHKLQDPLLELSILLMCSVVRLSKMLFYMEKSHIENNNNNDNEETEKEEEEHKLKNIWARRK